MWCPNDVLKAWKSHFLTDILDISETSIFLVYGKLVCSYVGIEKYRKSFKWETASEIV